DSTSYPSEWLESKIQVITDAPPLLVGLQACTTTLEISLAVPQKTGHSTTRRSSNTSLLGIYPEDVPTGNKDTCSTMFIAALFIIPRSWKEPRCPSTEEWIQKMWYIYTMEYYSAIKNNEFMKFLGKWMDLEDIILSEPFQS
ncbi:mCG144624, partial [Mus musculus]